MQSTQSNQSNQSAQSDYLPHNRPTLLRQNGIYPVEVDEQQGQQPIMRMPRSYDLPYWFEQERQRRQLQRQQRQQQQMAQRQMTTVPEEDMPKPDQSAFEKDNLSPNIDYMVRPRFVVGPEHRPYSQ